MCSMSNIRLTAVEKEDICSMKCFEYETQKPSDCSKIRRRTRAAEKDRKHVYDRTRSIDHCFVSSNFTADIPRIAHSKLVSSPPNLRQTRIEIIFDAAEQICRC